MVVVAEAMQLLLSLVSETTFVSSEHASKKYVPLGSVDGTVTEPLPLDVAAGTSEGTERLPVKRTLVPLFEVVVDR
jgi:hypothetical protein